MSLVFQISISLYIYTCKVHAVHLSLGSSNCFRPSLTDVPSQDWEGSCLGKGRGRGASVRHRVFLARGLRVPLLPFSHW